MSNTYILKSQNIFDSISDKPFEGGIVIEGNRIKEVFRAKDEPIEINVGKEDTELIVKHTGDRPIQVGSHYHFAEANFALEFDRKAAMGKHLDIPYYGFSS